MNNTSQENTFEMFIQIFKKWLTFLGINTQLFNELAGDDALPIWVRSLSAGVLLYLNSPIDLIPDKIPVLKFG